MIISIERWRAVLVVWCGLLAMAMGNADQKSSPKSTKHNKGMTTMRQLPSDCDGKSVAFFNTTWETIDASMDLDAPISVNYTVESGCGLTGSKMVLCYTANPSTEPSIVFLMSVDVNCKSLNHNHECTFGKGDTGTISNFEVTQSPQATASYFESGAFFFCLSNYDPESMDTVTCESYSPWFQLSANSTSQLPAAKVRRQNPVASLLASSLTPTTTLPIASTIESILTTVTEPSSTVVLYTSTYTPAPTPTTTSSSIGATITTPNVTPTATGTGSADASNTSDSSSSSSGSSGLPLGAKIGIALGAILFIFLLLLAILLLLRRRRKNPPPLSQTPENLLLAPSLQNNESRDLFMAEKLGRNGTTSTFDNARDINNGTPLTSRGINGVYDHEDDLHAGLPAPGSAFTTSTPVPISPRRSQAANTLRSEDANSRAISISSGLSRSISPVNGNGREYGNGNGNGTNSNGAAISREPSRERIDERSLFDEEPYSDNIVGGGGNSGIRNESASKTNLDIPKVYKGTLQAPFLSEPGMSAEEVARLEEEERRIDEAIAEAEEERERKRRVAMGMGNER